MAKLEFNPTKQWIKEHKHRPTECVCPDVPCYCILDHFNQHAYGFCVGISLGKDDGLDIIRFCDRTYNPETNDGECASRQWYPAEAQLVAMYLSFAAGDAWRLLPEYRQQLGEMQRKRTRHINRSSPPPARGRGVLTSKKMRVIIQRAKR